MRPDRRSPRNRPAEEVAVAGAGRGHILGHIDARPWAYPNSLCRSPPRVRRRERVVSFRALWLFAIIACPARSASAEKLPCRDQSAWRRTRRDFLDQESKAFALVDHAHRGQMHARNRAHDPSACRSSVLDHIKVGNPCQSSRMTTKRWGLDLCSSRRLPNARASAFLAYLATPFLRRSQGNR